MAFNMFVAVALPQASHVFTLGKTGGWALELQGCTASVRWLSRYWHRVVSDGTLPTCAA